METEHPAKRIKFLMRTCGVTVQDLAVRAGIPLEALLDILDERAVAPPSLLRRMADALGSKDTFLGGTPGTSAPGTAADGKARTPGHGPVRRRVGLAEVAARHEALLDLLLEKQVLTREEYDRRLVEVRAKMLLGRKRPAVPAASPAAPRAPGPGPGRTGPANRPR